MIAAYESTGPSWQPDYTRADFDFSPMIVFYEVTRACDLVCRHCRACAQRQADPNELSTALAKQLVGQLTEFPKPPILVLTGGDPLKRPDLCEIIEYAFDSGLEVAVTPSATPLVTDEAIARMRDAGMARLAVSLDGADAHTHDAVRGVPGSFERTLAIIAAARKQEIPVQVNTTLTLHNFDQIEAMAQLLAGRGIVLWSVFFLVPVGRAHAADRLNGQQCEEAFARLWHQAQVQRFAVKTTEAPHYRRFVLQQTTHDHGMNGAGDFGARPARRLHASVGVNDGKGIMFVSHVGMIHPSGFLPVSCGMFPEHHVDDVYQHSPIFQNLRNVDRLRGKCGVCEYRSICGGSRARAYALTGDLYAQEPDCIYTPRALLEAT